MSRQAPTTKASPKQASARAPQPLLDLPMPGPQMGEGEEWAHSRGYRTVVGVDEVGRGPLAGPVVAAAVWLSARMRDRLEEAGLDDSKRLSEVKRQAIAKLLAEETPVGIGVVDAARIDEINILRASFEAMSKAVISLQSALRESDAAPDLLLIDGNARIEPHPLPGVRQHTLVKGDRRSFCIAAASVAAKVHRDDLMKGYEDIYPGYGFARHKGYLSAMHREALDSFGPTPIHRRSFRGVSPASKPSREGSV